MIRAKFKELAYLVDQTLPVAAGREKATSITKIEEAMMWACAGIVRHSPGLQPIGISNDGKCNCTQATPCPLGKSGSEPRCTESELKAAGIQTIKINPQKS